MKKLLALVLAGVMAFSMVACGGGSDVDGGDEGNDLLKVNFICTNLGDKSFNDSAHYGLKAFGDEGKIAYKVTEYGQDNAKVNITLEEAAEEGYDVIMMNNLGYGMAAAWARENAANYPETTFVIFDEPVDMVEGVDNVQMVAYKANEADFLAGAVAAKLSKTGVIGFIGGMETPVIHDFLVGYIKGAQYVNPEVKVNVSYIGNYQDVAKAKDLGKTALNAGADVLHAVAGSGGNGYLEAAMEAGVYGIGVDSDQYEVFKTDKPDLAACIVTSSLKEVGKSLVDICQQMIDGTYTHTDLMWYGMEGAYCGVADNENYQKLVSEDIRAEIEAIAEKMGNGEITVPTAYGMPADELNAIVNSAK